MQLDPRLEADSTFVIDLALCHIRLHHNAAFPWILLIPQRSDITEIMDLSEADQQVLMNEIALASRVMQQLFTPDKLNVANLGNIVPQLHIHIIARYTGDDAWPLPVWNSGVSKVYDAGSLTKRLGQIKEAFLS